MVPTEGCDSNYDGRFIECVFSVYCCDSSYDGRFIECVFSVYCCDSNYDGHFIECVFSVYCRYSVVTVVTVLARFCKV